MDKIQKQRRFWMSDQEYKQLLSKAREHFKGKGFLSKYLRKISLSSGVFIFEGKGKIKLTMEKEK